MFKKLTSILLIAIIMLSLVSIATCEETKAKSFEVTLKEFKIIKESKPNMGNEWDKCIMVLPLEKNTPVPLEIDKTITVAQDNMIATIKIVEKDKYPDVFNQKYAIGEGNNEYIFKMYEQCKKNRNEKRWAVWKVVIQAKEVPEESPEPSISPETSISPSPEISDSPTTTIGTVEVSEEPIPATTAKVLPKTGENKNYTYLIIGGGLILIIAGIALFLKLKNLRQQ